MNIPMKTTFSWWDKTTERYQHWEVSTRPANPCRNIAAPIIAAMVQELENV